MRHTYMATMLFLLAALICVGAGGYYYLDEKYPMDAAFIQIRLDDPAITSKFKVEEARKAEYKDEEIAKYLADRNKVEFQRQFKLLLLMELTVLLTAVLVGGGIVLIKGRPGPLGGEGQ